MNAILIHANNLSPFFVDKFPGDKVVIDYSQSIQRWNFNLDRFLHEELSNAFKNHEYKVIFISYTLSQQNYLELTGLHIAAHIRLTCEFNHQHTPIVFIGPETPWEIAKLSEFSNILFTHGIFYTDKLDIGSIQNQYNWIIEKKPKLTDEELTKSIKRLQIIPPANYQSHHSIDNELALLRWSEYLQCDRQISEVKENLKTGLYFKYHRVLNPVKPSKTGTPYLISGEGKVLLIDDEAEKGWEDFYKCFFQYNINNKSIQFETLKLDFKSSTQENIIKEACCKVTEFYPDIVLLDLRLCDKDFNTNPQSEPKDFTGYKILEEIKKINKGIQVIITTASNKVWNYQSTYDVGANGYLIKKGDSDVAEDIKNIKHIVETNLIRAGYLKCTCKKIDSLRNSLDSGIRHKKINRNFGKELINLLEISFRMYDNVRTKEDFAYAYLALFKCLELIADEYTFIDCGIWQVVGPTPLNHYSWDDQMKKYKKIDPPRFKNGIPTTFEKIAALSFQLWKYKDTDVQQLYYSIKRRNEFIHPSEKDLSEKLKEECKRIYNHEGYFVLLKQISDIVNKITQ